MKMVTYRVNGPSHYTPSGRKSSAGATRISEDDERQRRESSPRRSCEGIGPAAIALRTAASLTS